jgi:ATP-binding cassette subfamily B protein
MRGLREKLRLGDLARALRFVWEGSPGWMIANGVLVVVQGTLPLLTLYLMKLVVDGVAGAAGAPDAVAAMRRVFLLIGLAALVAFLSAFFDALEGLLSEVQVQVVTDHMHDLLHAKAAEVDLEYYENSDYYDSLHRAQQEAPFRPTRIVTNLTQLSRSGLCLLGMAGLLISIHWAIAVILFLAILPGALVRLRYAEEMFGWQRKRTLTERRAQYFNLILTVADFAKELRLFDFGGVFRRRFCEIRRQLRQERLEIAWRRSVRDLVTQGVAIVPVFGAFGLVAYQTIVGAMTLGSLVMYYGAFQRAQSTFRSILMAFVGLYEDTLFLSSLYQFLDLKRQVVEAAGPEPFPRPIRSGITFDRVRFQYPRSDRTAIDEVSLIVRPGEIVALVGENGSGKTTLIKLLCRLYDPAQGSIRIDGVDLREFSTADLRRQISVVFQDFVCFHLTARENIWLGDAALPPDDEKIDAAAQLSGADEAIVRLRNGYDTVLGKLFEDGDQLSAGEWQKVAIARAFLRDAQVVILDEPTSALDARAEYEVFERFRQLIRGKTAILISHRLSSVRMADRIYVLRDGKIVESGTHDELVRRSGAYADLFELQAQHYR